MMKNKTGFTLISGPLANKCLIAVPNMTDERFENTVIYICSNSEQTGTVGLVVNKKSGLPFKDILTQVGITPQKLCEKNVLWGGPVEPIRGFVLHSNDFKGFETTAVSDTVSLTVSVDVLAKIAEGNAPQESLLCLGYSSWDAGQLELEIAGNSWLVMDCNDDYLFHCAPDKKWKKAFELMGIDPLMFSPEQGSV